MSFACTGSLQPHGPRIRSLVIAFAILCALLSAATSGVAHAEPGLEPGEFYVTRFSGTTKDGANTVIDTAGTVGSVIDIRNPAQAPRGQHWLTEPQHDPVTAGEVGQVFGVTLDDAETPNVYLTATSAFGLHRTPDNADWMKGMWGPTAGPGSVWKLDAADNLKPSLSPPSSLTAATTRARLLATLLSTRPTSSYMSPISRPA